MIIITENIITTENHFTNAVIKYFDAKDIFLIFFICIYGTAIQYQL